MAERVGFLGLGTMGAPMAEALVRAGYDVTVYNRSIEKTEPLAALGARVAARPAQVAQNSSVVFSCLLDDSAITEVYLGADGLLSQARQGQVFVEHATYSPALRATISERARLAGATLLDVPITGGPEGARAGTLVAMAGGPEEAVEQVCPLLLAYCEAVVRIGEAGAGLQLKLINQLLVTCNAVAAGVSMALLRAAELPVAPAARVLEGGWADSAMLRRALAAVREPAEPPHGAPISALLPVHASIAPALTEAGPAGGVYAAAAQFLTDVAAAGHASLDISQIGTIIEQTAGLVTPTRTPTLSTPNATEGTP